MPSWGFPIASSAQQPTKGTFFFKQSRSLLLYHLHSTLFSLYMCALRLGFPHTVIITIWQFHLSFFVASKYLFI